MMMSDHHPDQILENLSLLLSPMTLPDRTREAGKRLFRRMTSPIRVSLHGPDVQMSKTILARLKASQVPEFGAAVFADGGAFAQTDIVLWCTNSFLDAENATWQHAPNTLKDHSFLVACSPQLAQMQHLEDVAIEDFIACHHIPHPGDTPELETLLSELAKQIQSGLQADQDSARLFLQKHGAKLAVPAPSTRPVPLAAPKVLASQTDTSDASELMFQKAINCLSHHTTALLAMKDDDLSKLSQSVLQSCSAASEELVELMTTGNPDHPDYTALCDVIHEAADSIMLMSLENDLSSATDAVTVLLQIRKDLNLHLAI